MNRTSLFRITGLSETKVVFTVIVALFFCLTPAISQLNCPLSNGKCSNYGTNYEHSTANPIFALSDPGAGVPFLFIPNNELRYCTPYTGQPIVLTNSMNSNLIVWRTLAFYKYDNGTISGAPGANLEFDDDVNKVTFVPEPNSEYRMEMYPGLGIGTVYYDELVTFYLCTGPYGGGPIGTPWRPAVSVSNTTCSQVNLSITNDLGDNMIYYYSTSENNFSYTPAFQLSSSNTVTFNMQNQPSGTYYVRGHLPGTSYYTEARAVPVNYNLAPADPVFSGPGYFCKNKPAPYTFSAQLGATNPQHQIEWFSSDDLSTPFGYGENVTINVDETKEYFIRTRVGTTECYSNLVPISILPLDNFCNESFTPKVGEKYILQAWVSSDLGGAVAVENLNAIPEAKIQVNFYNDVNQLIGSTNEYSAQGPVVEGWQLMEQEFAVPPNTSKVKLVFVNKHTASTAGSSVYFDDVRVFKFNGSMISYVYDQETMRLIAELNQDNFYTKYIYNEAGELVKTNVESKDGIRTVVESRAHVKTQQ